MTNFKFTVAKYMEKKGRKRKKCGIINKYSLKYMLDSFRER